MSIGSMTLDLRGRRTTGERRYGLGLHFKLVLAGAATTLLGVASVSTFLVYQQAETLRDEINRATTTQQTATIERGRLLARTMGASFENALADHDIAFVTQALRSVQAKSDIAYALITDATGTIIAATDQSRVGDRRTTAADPSVAEVSYDKDDRRLVEVFQPLTIRGKPSGTLALAVNLRPVDSRAVEARVRGEGRLLEMTFVVVCVAALATFLCIAVSVFLSRRLLRPIVRLAEDAGALTEGNLDHEIRAVDSSDEIGFLARQFEMMRRSVKAYIGALVVAKQKAEASTREEKRLRAQIEEHSKLLEIKVKERTAELQRINAQLTEYDRMKSEFLSNVSHELRSPLAAIASAAKIIGRYGDVNRSTGKNFSSVILDETDRLGRLINDLLDLAKIESGKVEWNMECLENPGDLLAQVVETYRPVAAERGVTLEFLEPSTLPAIVVDRDRVIQVLTNLCSNAVKFTPRGGRVTVSGEATQVHDLSVLVVRVQDTGPGIPSDQLEKVFDRFHQITIKSNGDKPKGTGLGLAICREVITHHNGEIWAEAPQEGGTRMVFYLPAATAIETQSNDNHEYGASA
jgi:signal transduction histidine kinase